MRSPAEELIGAIDARLADYPGGSRQDIGAVTAVNVGGFPWGRQATQLFRADRYPDGLLKLAKTLGIFSGFSVIAGAKANETTTYEKGWRCFWHRH